MKASPYYGSYMALTSTFTMTDSAIAITGAILGKENLMDYSVYNDLLGPIWGPKVKAGITMSAITSSYDRFGNIVLNGNSYKSIEGGKEIAKILIYYILKVKSLWNSVENN